jgi:hypothetical protein
MLRERLPKQNDRPAPAKKPRARTTRSRGQIGALGLGGNNQARQHVNCADLRPPAQRAEPLMFEQHFVSVPSQSRRRPPPSHPTKSPAPKRGSTGQVGAPSLRIRRARQSSTPEWSGQTKRPPSRPDGRLRLWRERSGCGRSFAGCKHAVGVLGDRTRYLRPDRRQGRTKEPRNVDTGGHSNSLSERRGVDTGGHAVRDARTTEIRL